MKIKEPPEEQQPMSLLTKCIKHSNPVSEEAEGTETFAEEQEIRDCFIEAGFTGGGDDNQDDDENENEDDEETN